MPIILTPTSFKRLRKKFNLSRQDVAVEMKNSVSFGTIYNFEHGVPASVETQKELHKWMESKKNPIIKS